MEQHKRIGIQGELSAVRGIESQRVPDEKEREAPRNRCFFMPANKTKTGHFPHWDVPASEIELFSGGDIVYRSYNPNPARRTTNDCVIRAISKLMNLDWMTVYDCIADEGRRKFDTMDANHVWIGWLKRHGYKLYPIQNECPDCYTVQDFCKDHPHGRFLLGTGTHAVAVVDGDWYDSFNSGDLVPTFYMHRRP